MSGYIGTQPVPQATQTRDSFTATAGQTSFATSGYTPSYLDVYLNGVHLLNGTDYTATNGSDVVLTTGAAAGDVLEVVAYRTFDSANTYNRTEADAEFVSDPDDVITVSSGNVGIGTVSASAKLEVAPLGALRLQTGSGTMDCTPTAGAEDSFVWNTSLASPYVWKQAGTERMRIDAAGRVTMPYQPCFSASGSGLLTWSSGSTITKIVPLTYVPLNVGGHFSASTYRFTAPVAGNYLFAGKITQTGAVSGPSMHFYKNGAAYAFEGSIGYGVAYHSAGGEMIIPLAVGDYVDMRIINYNNVALTIDKSRCSLSGFLIG